MKIPKAKSFEFNIRLYRAKRDSLKCKKQLKKERRRKILDFFPIAERNLFDNIYKWNELRTSAYYVNFHQILAYKFLSMKYGLKFEFGLTENAKAYNELFDKRYKTKEDYIEFNKYRNIIKDTGYWYATINV